MSMCLYVYKCEKKSLEFGDTVGKEQFKNTLSTPWATQCIIPLERERVKERKTDLSL